MADVARIAASLGLTHAASEDLLDFAASVVNDAFEAPPEIREISVHLSETCSCIDAPVMPKPRIVQ